MELTIQQTNNTKGVAILMMLCLHLFNTRDYIGLFEPLIFIGKNPSTYYVSLFCDCCVAIYCFCSGYGLYIGFTKKPEIYKRKNYVRIFKLYINYWIILLLFAVLLGWILNNPGHPGTWQKFILNFVALDPSYNGAWWFFTTYIFLVFASPVLFKIIIKFNPIIILIISFIIYSLAYIQRIKIPLVFDSYILNWLFRQMALFGTSVFPFIIGALFFKYKIYSKIYYIIKTFQFPNILLLLILLFAIAGHGLVPSLYVAVFTGIIFIVCFNALDMPEKLNKLLQFLSKHSTNIWLIHMFFYMIYFKGIIYAPKNPTLIFTWLVLWCLVASYLVNFIYRIILKPIDKKLKIAS